MRRQEVSIEDIARAAGVSHSTVSRALRDSSLISADVRERIQQLAQQMGYTPNAIAQSLQTQRTNTIGLVVTSIDDPFMGDVVQGIEEVVQETDFSVVLSISHNDPDQEIAIMEAFHRRRVDGILVAASSVSLQENWIAIASGSKASLEEDVAAGESLLPRLLDAGITAVFCYNDMVAIGVLRACRERGICVPEELSVIGFDDIKMADY